MNLRHVDNAEIPCAAVVRERAETVRITVGLSVRDCAALWDAAAIKGLSAPGMRLSDLVDVIGPREDPSIAECIAMLAQPASIAGCELEHFEVESSSPIRVLPQSHDLKAA